MNIKHAVRQLQKDSLISALAIVSVAIGIHDLAHPRTSAHFTPLDVLDLIIVAIFIMDFVNSALATGRRKAYVKAHWYEIPSLIPLTGNMVYGAEFVPLLRGLRLVRLIRITRILRVIGADARLRSFRNTVFRIARHAHVSGLSVFAFLAILTGAAMSWLFEASANQRFRGGESIWWALNMFSNVAYVDFQPATKGGRIVAAILQFSGIAFIGIFTASLANALLTDKKEEDDQDQSPLD